MIQDKILDYVAVDLKHSMHRYEDAIGLAQPPEFYNSFQKLLQLLLENKIDYEYRTTIAKGLHTADDIENMAVYIR
jgi:pyruvate formate lyase activating enzyme